VTAADPSVTDDARAEAEVRWPDHLEPADADRIMYPRSAVRQLLRDTFVVGAQWAASRHAETTTELHPVVTEHQIIGTQTGKQGAGQVVPEDSVLCIKCGWMRCSDYTWHLSDALAAAGRAETTTEGWPRCKASRDGGCARCHDEHGRHVHCRAETTTATTEDAARVLYESGTGFKLTKGKPWEELAESSRNSQRRLAQALADAGLLATARTRPTREAIEEAIEAGKVAHDDAVAAGGAVGPQNDYIAEEVDALLNHDQPTEAEAGARALVHAAGDHFHAMVAAGAGNPGEVSTWLRERAASLRGGAR